VVLTVGIGVKIVFGQWNSGRGFDRGKNCVEMEQVNGLCHYRSIPIIKPPVKADGENSNRGHNP
jgi:hypothetical protein